MPPKEIPTRRQPGRKRKTPDKLGVVNPEPDTSTGRRAKKSKPPVVTHDSDSSSDDESTRTENQNASGPQLQESVLKSILDKLNNMEGELNFMKEQMADNGSSKAAADNTLKKRAKKSTPVAPAKGKSKITPQEGESESDLSSVEDLGDMEDQEENSEDEDIFAPFDHLVGDSTGGKLRKDILANKFVEFSDLLPEYGLPENKEYAFKVKDSGKSTTLVKQKHKRNLNIFEWLKAFDIYASVYIDRAKSAEEVKSLTKALLTYKRNMQDLKDKGYDWVAYDRHFRKKQEVKLRSWASLSSSLMLFYAGGNRGNNRSFRNFARGQPFRRKYQQDQEGHRTRIPKGYCFSYHNKNNFCSRKDCSYKHQCFKCERGDHPAYKCSSDRGPTKQGGQERGGKP